MVAATEQPPTETMQSQIQNLSVFIDSKKTAKNTQLMEHAEGLLNKAAILDHGMVGSSHIDLALMRLAQEAKLELDVLSLVKRRACLEVQAGGASS